MRELFVYFHVAGADHQLSALGHSVTGIDGQIHDDLLNVPPVCGNGLKSRLWSNHQLNVFAQ